MMDDNWTRIIVVRHGETEWNAMGRWQGWLDSSLTETGRGQAVEAGRLLESVGANALYCSDSGRACETARIIGEQIQLEARPDQAFRERYYGEYEGLNSDEIDAKFPGTRYEPGRDRRDTWRPIAGESLVEVSARVLAAIRPLAEIHPGETVIVVTHAGVLRVLDALASRENLEDIWDRVPPNCAIFQLEANRQGDLKIRKHFADGLDPAR